MQIQDIEQMKRAVVSLYPELDGIEPSIPLKQGAQGFVLLYSDRVIKAPRGYWAEESLFNEAAMLQKLGGIDTGRVSVPKVIEYDSSNHILVISRMRGDVLDANMMANMPSPQRVLLGRDLGILLAQIHEMEIFKNNDSWRDEKKKRFEMMQPKLDQAHLLEKAHIKYSDIPAMRQYMQGFSDLNEAQCTLHGDISLGNLLYDQTTGSLSVIDFAGSIQGYRHQEFLRMGNFHPEIHDACIDIYNQLSPVRMTPEILSTSRKVQSFLRVAEGNCGLEMEFKPI